MLYATVGPPPAWSHSMTTGHHHEGRQASVGPGQQPAPAQQGLHALRLPSDDPADDEEMLDSPTLVAPGEVTRGSLSAEQQACAACRPIHGKDKAAPPHATYRANHPCMWVVSQALQSSRLRAVLHGMNAHLGCEPGSRAACSVCNRRAACWLCLRAQGATCCVALTLLDGTNRLVLACSGTGISFSDDNGASWTRQGVPASPSSPARSLQSPLARASVAPVITHCRAALARRPGWHAGLTQLPPAALTLAPTPREASAC